MKKLIITLLIAGMLIPAMNFAQDTWTQKTDLPGTARWGSLGFSIGTKGYIGTGFCNDGTTMFDAKDFWEYDPGTDTWTQKADVGGTVREQAVGFSIGLKGYIGTGMDFSVNAIFLNDFWEYDPSTNIWTQKANFGGAARAGSVGFSIGTKGYIGTGYCNDGTTEFYTKDFWEYDPGIDSWSKLADFGGTARGSATGFSIGTKGYIGTGGDNVTIFMKDFWEFDPGINSWSQKADFGGTARTGAVGFAIETKGYIGTGRYNNDFWEYDPGINSWSEKAYCGGTGRDAAAGFSIGTKGYIGTGDEEIWSKDFWEYSPSSVSVNEISLNDQIISVFPNPVADNLTVVTHPKSEIKILNIEGQIIKTIYTSDKETTIDLKDLPSGVYIIKATDNKGVSMRRFVKK